MQNKLLKNNIHIGIFLSTIFLKALLILHNIDNGVIKMREDLIEEQGHLPHTTRIKYLKQIHEGDLRLADELSEKYHSGIIESYGLGTAITIALTEAGKRFEKQGDEKSLEKCIGLLESMVITEPSEAVPLPLRVGEAKLALRYLAEIFGYPEHGKRHEVLAWEYNGLRDLASIFNTFTVGKAYSISNLYYTPKGKTEAVELILQEA